MQSVPTVVRTLIAAFLALAGPVLAAPAVQAHAQEIQQQSSRTDAAASHQLTISIDAVSPNFATSNKPVTVSGTLTNHTGSAIAGMVVQLFTSPQWFLARSSMDSFASGSSWYLPEQAGLTYAPSGVLAKGATVRWKVSFSPAQAASFAPVQAGYPLAGYTQFGVYPLEAEALSSLGTQLATSRTFLPFWPGNGSAKPLGTAWIWPLIDQPQQDICGQSQVGATMTLATNSLAGSLGSGGRLGTLLATGERWARQDQLTWAVDPALLSDASVMTHPYTVGGNVGSDAMCTGRVREPASTAARNWLSELRTDTANESMFVTPYADVDVSALSHVGLDADLRTAYQLGESVAGKILSRPFGTNAQRTGDGGAPAVAWPAGGTADASVLTSLASNGGINTVVLNSGELPSTTPPYDNALGSTTTGIGSTMHVLLADSHLTGILGSASAGSSAAAQFAAEQDFLAQTAMISAEAPNSARSLVIAPPRHWDPSAAEAEQLLSLTSKAPWLHKVPLSSLAAAAGNLSHREMLPGNQVTRAQLGDGYLDQVSTVGANVALYKDLLYKPPANMLQSLDAAVAVTESTAWRGANAGGGWLALDKLAAYLTDAENNVRNITGTKVLLAGSSGDIPVSVQNLNPYPVQVEVKTTLPANSRLSVGKFDDLLKVLPGQTGTKTMPMHSAALGTTTMQLQLATKDGSPLTWTTQSLSVQATRYGQALLVLIGAALGVLVLASVARWVRRWLNDGRADGRSGGTG
jgi:hypothetical protein